MARCKFSSFLCLLIGLLSIANAARILALFPVPGKSHFSCNEAMMKSLHAAGHSITFVSPFPSKNRIENFTMINSHADNVVMLVGQTPLHYFGDMSLVDLFYTFIDLYESLCYDVLKLKEIQEALNSSEKLYDVMFTELLTFFPDCYAPIAEKLGIPIIGTVTMRTLKLADSVIGLPNNPASIPFECNDFKTEMTFVQRLQNIYGHLITDYFAYYCVPPMVQLFYQKNFPGFQWRSKKISMTFYNTHASVLSRPTVPNVVEVAGIHIQPAKPLPPNLREFIDGAKAGVILFSLGSVVNTSSMSVAQRNAFVKAFAVIPQRVIWKFEKPIDDLTNNVLISSWVPQRDILGHKNVKAFISHCGLSGTYEAIHTGTPVITAPLFGDQWSNAAVLEKLGVGVRLDVKTVTTDKVLEALNTIINDTRYYDTMQNLSRTFKDRPMTPQQSIVYWTEYVIKHDGALHLQAVGSDMPFYQYFLLDIIFVVVVLVTATLCTIAYVTKKVYRMFVKTRNR